MGDFKVRVALGFALSPLLVAQQSALKPASTRLPKGTAIHLKLDQDVSSETAREGQKIRYLVSEDVVADGVVAIPTGTQVFRKVNFVVPAGSGQPCSDESGGWFSLEDRVFRSSIGMRMKLTTLPPLAFPKEPMSTHDKVIAVAMAPLQVPAVAILIAAPVVLLPMGVAAGVHERLHRPKAQPATPAPCFVKIRGMEWKASDAKVETYYLAHSYNVSVSPLPGAEQLKANNSGQ